jgi:hypothetical protein
MDFLANLIIGLGLNLLFGVGDFVTDEVTAYRQAEQAQPCPWGEIRQGAARRCKRMTAFEEFCPTGVCPNISVTVSAPPPDCRVTPGHAECEAATLGGDVR